MTMFVDRRKDNYDELLVLATDARLSRTRTNRWSTGLVITAMLGTAAYVAAMSQRVEEIRSTAEDAVQQRDTAVLAYQRILGERNELRAELNALARFQDLYAEIGLNESLNKVIGGLTNLHGIAGDPDGPSSYVTTNIVWMVDGSRRFPMVDGDILWIPEGGFWIRLDKDPQSGERSLFRIETPPDPVTGAKARGKVIVDTYDEPYRHAINNDALNCVRFTLHESSIRPIFRDQGYADVEVLYYSPDETDVPCTDNLDIPDDSDD